MLTRNIEQEGWSTLTVKTLLDLAQCYSILGDKEKYVRTCAQIASSQVAKESERSHYFDEMMNTLAELKNDDKIILCADDIINFKSCQIVKQSVEQKIIPGVELTFSLELQNNLPKPICCDSVKICLTYAEPEPVETPAKRKESESVKPDLDRRSQG